MLKAVTRSARAVDERVNAINAERASRGQSRVSVAYYFDHYSSNSDSDVMVTEEDFYRAKDDLVPSVSVDELRHYENVRNTFEGAAKSSEEATAAVRPEEPPIAARPEEAPIVVAQRLGKAEQNGSGARSRAMEALKRLGKSKNGGMNGSGNQSHANAGQGLGIVEDEDDYVIRTDRLALNNGSDRPTSSKGKGKGKGKAREAVVDGPAGGPVQEGLRNGNAEQGEDLYD